MNFAKQIAHRLTNHFVHKSQIQDTTDYTAGGYSDLEDEADQTESYENDEFEAAEEEKGEEECMEEEIKSLSEQLERVSSALDINGKPRRYGFKLKQTQNGNILTVHHTVQEGPRLVRIRIAAYCFNLAGTQLLVIDKRGNIFVFDFNRKRYWHLNFLLPRVSFVRASLQHIDDYIVGNKLGQIYVIDVENCVVVNSTQIATTAIDEISHAPTQHAKPQLSLVRFGHDALLLNLETFLATHRLEFDKIHYSLKFASFMPHSEHLFTCFSNDSVQIWSSQTLNTLRVTNPIKSRDRKLRLLPAKEPVPEITLKSAHDSDTEDALNDEYPFNCQDQDFSNGCILCYCFTADGNKLCLCTLDGYLLLFNAQTFNLDKIYRLRNFVIKQLQFLPMPRARIVFALTTAGQVVMLDLENTDLKLIVQAQHACSLQLCENGKLLAICTKYGELQIWVTCRLHNKLLAQTQCVNLLREAVQQKKPIPPQSNVVQCLHPDLRNLLKPKRLIAILSEFGHYPTNYRQIIWTALLDLPCNTQQFQELLKMRTPDAVQKRAQKLSIKTDAEKRVLIRVWSCLAHWCKVFAYADFMPQFIFPFVKVFPKNSLICFELLATLLLNHFQHWFEFHPLEPANYLAMCDNLLQSKDELLCKYYKSIDVTAKDYAWSMLSNAFSEVLDTQQWLVVWDNIITEKPYFPIFITVAYNLLQREVLLRLPDRAAVLLFFHEQNPIDVSKLLRKARRLVLKCTPTLHPERYIQQLEALPKNCYPKFLNYPNKWVNQQEAADAALIEQHKDIDARIRHLELQEIHMMRSLEEGLKQEEHARRVKEMENVYQSILRREEDRLGCQRKMLMLYQKELRQRKGEIFSKLQQSEQRRKAYELERELETLTQEVERERRRNNQQMLLAEDEIRNQELELLAQQYGVQLQNSRHSPLAKRFYENVQRLCHEREMLKQTMRVFTLDEHEPHPATHLTPELNEIEKCISEIQREVSEIMSCETIPSCESHA